MPLLPHPTGTVVGGGVEEIKGWGEIVSHILYSGRKLRAAEIVY